MSVKLKNANSDPLVIKPQQLGPGDLAVFPPIVVKKTVSLTAPVTDPLVKVQAEPTPRKAS